MSTLVKPHGGGDLKPLLLEGDALAAEKARSAASSSSTAPWGEVTPVCAVREQPATNTSAVMIDARRFMPRPPVDARDFHCHLVCEPILRSNAK